MSAKKELIEKFEKVHNEYLLALSEYVPPAARGLMVEESLQKASGVLSNGEEVTDEVVLKFVGSIEDAKKEVTHPKGTCSPACLSNLLMMQDSILTLAMSRRMEKEAFFELLEYSNHVVGEVVLYMLELAPSSDAAWVTGEKVHKRTNDAIALLDQIRKTMESETSPTSGLPATDKTKYKEGLN